MRISDWSSDLCSSDLIRWTIVPLCDRVQSRASANHQDGPMSTRPRTLYEKIWDAHVVDRREDGTCLIYIDRHLVHEVTSPQAFEGLRSEEHTSELQSLMRISYAVFCLKKKTNII